MLDTQQNQIKLRDNPSSSNSINIDSDASTFDAEDSNSMQLEQSSNEFDDQSNGDHDSNQESADPKASGSKAKLSKQPKQKVARPKNYSKNCIFCHCHESISHKSIQNQHQKHYFSKNTNKKLKTRLHSPQQPIEIEQPKQSKKLCQHCKQQFVRVKRHEQICSMRSGNSSSPLSKIKGRGTGKRTCVTT